MRFFAAVAVGCDISLASGSISVAAQDGPTLEPGLSFEVASVKVVSQRERSPMQWQPPGQFTGGIPILSLVSIGYLVPISRTHQRATRRSTSSLDRPGTEN